MLKTVVTTIFIYCSALTAQKWCPPGATWHHTVYGQSITSGYQKIQYEKDTMIQGQSCKKLTGITKTSHAVTPFTTFTSYPIRPVFTYEKNDTVFFCVNHTFRPIFFFNAKVGDTVNLYNFDLSNLSFHFCDSFTKATVDSIGKTVIHGDTLRFYEIIGLSNKIKAPKRLRIIEKFGALYSTFLPTFYCGLDADAYTFNCYEDNAFPLYQMSKTTACDYIESNVKQSEEDKIKISSIPGKEIQLTLSNEHQYKSIQMFHINGTLLQTVELEQSPNTNTISIPMDQAVSGIYLIKIMGMDQQNYCRKIAF